MHLKFQNTSRLRFAVLAAWLGMAATAGETLAAEPASPLRQAFEAAWSRQPEALALPSRLDAAAAQRRAAQRWTPDAPALELSNKTDRLTSNLGSRELAMGVAVPLWLPDERGRATALADAQVSAIDSRTQAARLRVAATVPEAWWNWKRAVVDSETAGDQLDNAERIAADVARRLKAGEPPPKATATSTPIHAALADLRDRADVLERAAALAAAQSRADPELTLSTARDRGAFGGITAFQQRAVTPTVIPDCSKIQVDVPRHPGQRKTPKSLIYLGVLGLYGTFSDVFKSSSGGPGAIERCLE